VCGSGASSERVAYGILVDTTGTGSNETYAGNSVAGKERSAFRTTLILGAQERAY
jgi:hypothetical protein